MAWLYILIAGMLEVVWVIGLKYSDSFTKLLPSIITIAASLLSFWFLSLSMKTLPMGIAYAVWTGIGTIGAILFGVIYFGEAITILRVIAFALIVIGIIGLKLSDSMIF